MIKFLFRKRKYLDLIFSLNDARSLVEELNKLLAKNSIEKVTGIREFGENKNNERTLRLALSNEDLIEINSKSINLMLNEETCNYAVAKLNSFIDLGDIFPAEFQSFENTKEQRDVMVYFFAADAYSLE